VTRLLVACVGNVLRGDDGFGPAVADRMGDLPAGVDVVETGIGGVALLQELMAGCDGLVLVDATDRGAEPGTLFVLEPHVEEAVHVPDVHLANPDRVLSLAQALGCLPSRVLLVGCQPGGQELGEGLSPSVQRAVGVAVEEVRATVEEWLRTAAPGTGAGDHR
jgi:hydrogenase maturation protease